MTVPTSLTRPNCVAIAMQFDDSNTAMLSNLAAWRAAINTNSASGGGQAQDNYQRIMGLRKWVAVNITARPQADRDAIIAAYKTIFSGISTFDPATDWPPAVTAITNFKTWFQANWPKTAGGAPAFHLYDADDLLADNSVAITAGTKTTVLGLLDAITTAFG